MTYQEWWNNVASAMQPLPNEDIEEFAHRITALAWFNGENSERDACAKVVDDIEARCIAKDVDDPPLNIVAKAIRARGES